MHLGVRISRVSSFIVHRSYITQHLYQGPADRDIKKKIKQKRNTDEEYELSRFKPLLKTVIEVRMIFTLLREALSHACLGSCREQIGPNVIPLPKRPADRGRIRAKFAIRTLPSDIFA
jgi:hypothetical protein